MQGVLTWNMNHLHLGIFDVLDPSVKKGEDPPISVPKYLTELCFQHEVSFPGTVVSHLSHVLGTGAVMKSGNG